MAERNRAGHRVVVIIDDYRYGWGNLSEHFVKTDPNFRMGIEKDQVEEAIKILN